MELPAAWYPLLPASRLRRGRTVRVALGGVDLAVFRGGDGTPGCLLARCAHLGADLANGRVVGDRLRCPLHHRSFAADGSGDGHAQPSLPLVERWGLVFARLGDPRHPLPRPDGIADGLRSGIDEVAVDAPGALIAANAFDADHLAPVHGRMVVGEPALREPAPGAIAIAFAARVAGDGLRDRLLRRCGLGEVAIETWCWGGSLLLFHHRRVAACTVLALRPIDNRRTRAYAVTLRAAPAGAAARAAARLGLALQHRLIAAFAGQDVAALAGSRLGPNRLDPSRDALLARFLAHQAALPAVPWGGP